MSHAASEIYPQIKKKKTKTKQKKGIKEGDTLLQMNNRDLLSPDHYERRLASRAIQSTVPYKIRRQKSPQKVVTVAVRIEVPPSGASTVKTTKTKKIV